MTTDLTGRSALVTGGASGIGRACAHALARCGARVTVADADGDGARWVAQEVDGDAWHVDLSRPAELDSLERDTDVLVNCAGVQTVDAVEHFDPARWRFIVDLMLVAPFGLIRAVLPGMYARGWGRIVNISSVHGLRASPYKSAYVAAKHGLEGLSKTVALEGAARGVTSNCVNPGYVRTRLVTNQIADQARVHHLSEQDVVEKVMLAESPVKRLVEPGEVADLVTWLVGDTAGMVNGASYTMDGGWTAH